jgi:hypothetical protein
MRSTTHCCTYGQNMMMCTWSVLGQLHDPAGNRAAYIQHTRDAHLLTGSVTGCDTPSNPFLTCTRCSLGFPPVLTVVCGQRHLLLWLLLGACGCCWAPHPFCCSQLGTCLLYQQAAHLPHSGVQRGHLPQSICGQEEQRTCQGKGITQGLADRPVGWMVAARVRSNLL